MGCLVALTLAADAPEAMDSLVLSAPALLLANPLAPGQPLHFLTGLVFRAIKRWNMPPTYADPALERFDTNYPWTPSDAIATLFEFCRVTRGRLGGIKAPMLLLQSRNDSTVSLESAPTILRETATPAALKRLVWFEKTEHEMFLDMEWEQTVATVVEYVRDRAGI
jgi:carboxylesterase